MEFKSTARGEFVVLPIITFIVEQECLKQTSEAFNRRNQKNTQKRMRDKIKCDTTEINKVEYKKIKPKIMPKAGY